MANQMSISQIKAKAGERFELPQRHIEIYELGKENGQICRGTYYAIMSYGGADRVSRGRVVGMAHYIVPHDGSDCVLRFEPDLKRLPSDIIRQLIESRCNEGMNSG